MNTRAADINTAMALEALARAEAQLDQAQQLLARVCHVAPIYSAVAREREHVTKLAARLKDKRDSGKLRLDSEPPP